MVMEGRDTKQARVETEGKEGQMIQGNDVKIKMKYCGKNKNTWTYKTKGGRENDNKHEGKL